MKYAVKYLIAFASSLGAMIVDARWMLVLLLFAIVADCITAFRLSRRVRKKYPDKVGFNGGYFATEKADSKAFRFVGYASAVLFAMALDEKVMIMWSGLYLANYVTIILIALEAISCLENESSCNGSKAALVLQKILIDKTQRHLDIDLNSLIHSEDEKKI